MSYDLITYKIMADAAGMEEKLVMKITYTMILGVIQK